MRRALWLALLALGCGRQGPPVIESFTVDDANPDEGQEVHFSYVVRNAVRVVLGPVPGIVTSSPVNVTQFLSATYSLQAFNAQGDVATREIPITVHPRLSIDVADATPGQVAAGGAVTLSWATTSAEGVSLTDGATGQVTNVAATGSTVVHPTVTTLYTLTATNRPGKSPAMATAKIAARVAQPPSVSSFTATPSLITQGDFSTLRWSGNATSYSITDGTTTFNVAARRDLVVRPAATTNYTLDAIGPGGPLPSPPHAVVTVEPHPATNLVYTAPSAGDLQMVADSCVSPCTEVTLRIKATAKVQLRGIALDLPLDRLKVGFLPADFVSSFPGAVSQAKVGSGPLQDTLVIGIALEGSGSAPAPDATFNSGEELARFKLTLLSAGGRGPVFDGASTAGTAYKASIQSASGRTANAIAVGKLEAQ
jgi:hypothetical protein